MLGRRSHHFMMMLVPATWLVQGLLLNTAIVVGLDALLARWLEGPLRYNLAKAVAVGVVLLWNYGANRLWTFNVRNDLSD